MLIVLGGLPGVGKSTLARQLVIRSGFAYLRLDTIEQALRNALAIDDVGPAGYRLAYAWAASNLELGVSVVVDCVNPLEVTRSAWRAVAASASSLIVEVEVVCSDSSEHRRRIETRTADIEGLKLPGWDDVLSRDYQPWTTSRRVIDSASASAAEAAESILAHASCLGSERS
ncbi:Kinase [Burkholderiales bacterium 8X]|nr:Kinase [Burkholderiales bacterium 8X]